MRLPWQSRDDPDDRDGQAGAGPPDCDPAHSCEFMDGTLAVCENAMYIDRSSNSKFADKSIPMTEVRDVTFEKRLFISYLQIDQFDVENGEGGLFSTPVDENTLHFGRGQRLCARRARDAIFERMGVE
jgi:hypothetical protein